MPNRLFDGQTRVLSTCRSCRELMIVLAADETVHPCCEPKPTKLESLAAGWLSTVLDGDGAAEELTAREIDTLDSAPPQLRQYAIRYARMGWPVFPLGARSKKPAIPKSKGGNGLLDATTDLEKIAKWWADYPQSNIGLATGHLFDVIDIDPRSGGVPSFLKLLTEKIIPDIHGIAVTASGGIHLYVQPTGRGNYAGVRSGIDYRGLGGYVVGAPSTLNAPGRSWSWMTVPSPEIRGDR